MNKKTIKTFIKDINLVWRYGYNFLPTVNYLAETGKKLSKIEGDTVNALDKNGIFITSVEKLMGENTVFDEMQATAEKLLEDRKPAIDELRLRVNDASIGDKTFNLELLGSELVFEPGNVFARFALNKTLLNIANAYFKMQTKLRYYNVWKTFACSSVSRESQLWHYDREDKFILKLFLYLEDVDEGNGPFTYAPQTHKKGALSRVAPEFFLEGNVRRSTDEQMNAVFAKERWVRGIGKKGTIIFADTRGYHKGGEARTKDRLMYTCMYTSGASESKRLIHYPHHLKTDGLDKKQIAALEII